MKDWIVVSDSLPEDGARVICFLPDNLVHLPGKSGATEQRNILIMKFSRDFFMKNPSKTGHTGSPHFWLGEGSSNQFFNAVSHWMPLPVLP
ncbi:MAG: DUF551 domain-containing protein [Bacteroidota bacterium]|nr:DUF551 domain-containing protein [Bacteroidota bacterium]